MDHDDWGLGGIFGEDKAILFLIVHMVLEAPGWLWIIKGILLTQVMGVQILSGINVVLWLVHWPVLIQAPHIGGGGERVKRGEGGGAS